MILAIFLLLCGLQSFSIPVWLMLLSMHMDNQIVLYWKQFQTNGHRQDVLLT